MAEIVRVEETTRARRGGVVGGHEGAGVVHEVGTGVAGLAVGDRIIISFLPSCGPCRACALGMTNLCERGMYLGDGTQISDHTARHPARGQDLGIMCLLGTFAEHTVVSDALDPTTQIGPMASRAHRERVESYIARGSSAAFPSPAECALAPSASIATLSIRAPRSAESKPAG